MVLQVGPHRLAVHAEAAHQQVERLVVDAQQPERDVLRRISRAPLRAASRRESSSTFLEERPKRR